MLTLQINRLYRNGIKLIEILVDTKYVYDKLTQFMCNKLYHFVSIFLKTCFNIVYTSSNIVYVKYAVIRYCKETLYYPTLKCLNTDNRVSCKCSI